MSFLGISVFLHLTNIACKYYNHLTGKLRIIEQSLLSLSIKMLLHPKGRKLKNGGELHVALYFRTFKNHISKFQKHMKKILEVANDVYYKCAKF
jgi:hypothetical protein